MIKPGDFDIPGEPVGASRQDADPRAAASATGGRRMRAALVVVSLACCVSTLGWLDSSARSERLAEEVARLRGSVGALTSERNALEVEIAKLAPPSLSISTVEIANTRDGSQVVETATAGVFPREDLRFVTYEVTGPNPLYGKRDFTGVVDVKFIAPDGTVDGGQDSPSDATQSLTVQAAAHEARWAARNAWGHPDGDSFARGTWKLQFVYRGRVVRETTFKVV